MCSILEFITYCVLSEQFLSTNCAQFVCEHLLFKTGCKSVLIDHTVTLYITGGMSEVCMYQCFDAKSITNLKFLSLIFFHE